MKKWYTNTPVRNLVDMHIPNGEGYLEKFDPAAYAENVKRSGASVAYIYSCNCLGLCFYPTKVGLRHKEADRDIFGETVKECRKRGLGVVGYTNTWATFVVDKHPEWNVIFQSGKTKRDTQRFGTPCVNNDEYVEYVCAHVKELVSSYKLDGLWLDMVGIAAPVCYCEVCKKKYFDKYGKDLPSALDKKDPDIYNYLRFKTDAVEHYLRRVRETALEADPSISVAFQSASAAKHPLSYGTGSCFYLSDYLSGDFYTDRPGVNVTCRLLYKATNNLPFEFMTSRCVGLERHTMNKNINELILQSYAAIMYKGSFMFIDAIDPDGEMNGSFYDDIKVISKNIEKYIPYTDLEEKPLRDVAVYHNSFSWLPRKEGTHSLKVLEEYTLFNDLKSIDNILSKAHIDYDILNEKTIDDFKNYKAIIFPSLTSLNKAECDILREYVKNGGKAYISGVTSLYDDMGSDNKNFALSDLLGVDFKGFFDIKPNYISPTDERPSLFGSHTRKYPHMLEENMVRVTPNDKGKILATVTLPIGDVSDNIVFSSAISDPPINYTDHPALFEHCYGKGKVIYSAGFIENDPMPDSAQLFTDIIKELVGDFRVTVDAPSCVDSTAYEGKDRISLNFLNNQTIVPPIRIDRITAKVKLYGRKIRNVTDVSGGKTEWSVSGDILTVNTDLEFYKLISVEL